MFKKTALSAAVALSLGSGNAQAVVFNMTFMDHYGTDFDNSSVVGTVDTANGGSGVFNSGGVPFFGYEWTATVAAVYTGGATAWSYSTATGALASGTYNFTLAPGQVAMGLLWDWNLSTGMPVLNIMNADGSGVDIDGDGVLGTVIQDGPITTPLGFAGMPVSAVPLPAAIWLMWGGLAGLLGIARRNSHT